MFFWLLPKVPIFNLSVILLRGAILGWVDRIGCSAYFYAYHNFLILQVDAFGLKTINVTPKAYLVLAISIIIDGQLCPHQPPYSGRHHKQPMIDQLLRLESVALIER